MIFFFGARFLTFSVQLGKTLSVCLPSIPKASARAITWYGLAMEASKNTEAKGTTKGSSDELVEINTTPQYAGITEGQVAPKHQVARPNDRTTAQVGLEFAGA